MTRQLVFLRLKHLLHVRIFFWFAAGCILLNIYIAGVTFKNRQYPAYTAEFARNNGIQITEESITAAEKLPDSDLKDSLIQDLYNCEDPWKDSTAQDIYNGLSDLVPLIKDQPLMQKKYDLLQKRIDTLRLEKEYQDLSCGSVTNDLYNSIFSMIMRLLTVEILMSAVGAAVWTAYEDQNAGAEQSIAVTRTGRRIQASGYIASLILVMGIWLAIGGTTILYLSRFCHLDSFLRSSLSSCYNVRLSGMMPIPFVSWIPLTGAKALFLHWMLQGALAFIFHGIAYALSLWQSSSLHTLMTMLAGAVLLFLAAYILVRNNAFYPFALSLWNPVMTAYLEYIWFTDMGLYSVIPMQETWISLTWIVITVWMIFAGLKKYQRKDLKE